MVVLDAVFHLVRMAVSRLPDQTQETGPREVRNNISMGGGHLINKGP